MKIYIGADHGGFEAKKELIAWLEKQGREVVDCGNTKLEKEDDYPDFAFSVAEHVAAEEGSFGILVCRSSAGMVIAANKVIGIRAVSCFDEKSTIHAREHNDANIIGLSGDWMNIKEMKKFINLFLNTKTSIEPRHKRRVGKILDYEEGCCGGCGGCR